MGHELGSAAFTDERERMLLIVVARMFSRREHFEIVEVVVEPIAVLVMNDFVVP
jgi:hypothetical protein